jgi:hypothetical protein
MIIEHASFMETQLTGWVFTLRYTFRGAEYAAKYVEFAWPPNCGAWLTKNGQPTGRIPLGVAKRFNATARALGKASNL